MNRFLKFAIVLLAAATFLLLLGRKDIVTSHEARVAQTARVMAASGPPWNATPARVAPVEPIEINGQQVLRAARDRAPLEVNPWLVPVINQRLRLEKPPLPYWATALVFRGFGFGEWQSRIVPAILGFLATFLIADVARMLLGRRAALIAAGVWLSTHFVVDEFRKSMADPYLAFFGLLCVWSWMRASTVSRDAKRSEARELPVALRFASRLTGWLVALFYVSLALGALAKGPVIFVHVALALVALHLFRRRRVGPWWAHVVGIVIFCAIAAPWPIYVIQHVPHAIDIWRYESVGEMTGENVEKARPWFSYIGYSFQLPLPWTPLWLAGLAVPFVHARRGLGSSRNRRRFVAILWQVATIVFFSMSGVKKPAYLLPVMAAQTLIITDALLLLLAFARRTKFRQMPAILALAQAAIGLGFAGGLAFVMIRSATPGIAIAVIATIAAALAFFPIVCRCARSWLMAQVVAYACILVALLGFQRPDEENRRSARPFAQALAQYLPVSNYPLMVNRLPEELAVYLPLELPNAGELPFALMAVDHSLKDPPETPQTLSLRTGDATVLEAERIDLKCPDGRGRWQLFKVRLDRSRPRA